MNLPRPIFISSTSEDIRDFEEEFGCSARVINFFLSELIDLEGAKEVSEGYVALSESLLMLTRDHIAILKRVIFYGMHYGIQTRDPCVLNPVLIYIDILFKKLGISSSDRIALCSARICVNFELFSLTGEESYLSQVITNHQAIEQLLAIHPHLANHFGWEHFQFGISSEEYSPVSTARVYTYLGKTYLWLYHKERSQEFLVKSCRCFTTSLKLVPNQASVHSDYAECLQILGLSTGKSSYVQQAMEHLSRAIFLSFNRNFDDPAYENYRYNYAVAAVKLFDLTYEKEHFYQANRIVYQAIQACPQFSNLWILWGELLIRSGWLNSNMKYIEVGLDKLSSAQKKGGDPIILSSLLASGIAMLGLYLDEPNLFKESRIRLLAAMKAFPGNTALVHALGTVQLCSALYFSDDASFSSAASCFRSCIDRDAESISSWQKLFDVYFAWGVRKRSAFLLQKTVSVVKRLCYLRPEIFLFWSDRGLALRCLAEVTTDLAYKEIYLEESLLYYRKAWDLSQPTEILELWGHSYFLLADLQQSQKYYDEAYKLLSSIDEEKLSFRAKLLLASTLLGKGHLVQDEDLVKKALVILNTLVKDHVDQEEVLLLLGKAWLFLFWKSNCLEAEKLAKMYLEQAVALGCSEAYYTLAKFYAIKKEVNQAWGMILRSVDFGFKITESHWLNDPYLANVRAGHAFHEVMASQRG